MPLGKESQAVGIVLVSEAYQGCAGQRDAHHCTDFAPAKAVVAAVGIYSDAIPNQESGFDFGKRAGRSHNLLNHESSFNLW